MGSESSSEFRRRLVRNVSIYHNFELTNELCKDIVNLFPRGNAKTNKGGIPMVQILGSVSSRLDEDFLIKFHHLDERIFFKGTNDPVIIIEVPSCKIFENKKWKPIEKISRGLMELSFGVELAANRILFSIGGVDRATNPGFSYFFERKKDRSEDAEEEEEKTD